MNLDPEQQRCFPRENNQGEVGIASQEASAGWFVRTLLQLVNFVGKWGWGEQLFTQEFQFLPLSGGWEGAAEAQLQELAFGSPQEMFKLWKSREVLLFHHGTAQNTSRFFPLGCWELSSS